MENIEKCDKKLTDNEIVKALECCTKNNNCTGCPLEHLDFASECASQIVINSLDLINRQKAENDRLNNELHLKVEYIHEQREVIDEKKAEIERLVAECGNQSTLWSKHFENIFETAKETIKAEAYKECIEKVKEKSTKTELVYSGALVATEYTITGLALNNLLKELVGEDG